MLDKYIAPDPDVAARLINNEIIILTPFDGVLHNLNPVATYVWCLMDGKHRLKDIILCLCSEYDVLFPAAERDVMHFVEDMLAKRIIVLSDKPIRKHFA